MKKVRFRFLISTRYWITAISYLLLATVLCGCATSAGVSALGRKDTVFIHGTRYVSSETLCRIYNLESDWDSIAKRLILKNGNHEVRMMADSSIMLINNTVHVMDKEARLYQGSLVIPKAFSEKRLIPLFKERFIKKIPPPAKISGLPIKNVIIDPGHGGKDPGAIGRNGLKEKDIVLDIAKALKKKLNAAGINVILTRESDIFVSLYQRCQISNRHAKEADFFISIHANASRSRWTSGVEVFYLSESIDDDRRSTRAAENYELNLDEGYSGKNTAAILWDLVLSDDRKSSIQLARFVCSSLSQKLSQRNRGKKPARFYVLNAHIPAILVEVGFISNLAEEKQLRSVSYRDKIAQAVAEGVFQYNRSLTQRQYTAY